MKIEKPGVGRPLLGPATISGLVFCYVDTEKGVSQIRMRIETNTKFVHYFIE